MNSNLLGEELNNFLDVGATKGSTNVLPFFIS